jgi:hypothetical protein
MKFVPPVAPNFGTSNADFFGGDFGGVVDGTWGVKRGMDDETEAEPELAGEGPASEAKGFVGCPASFAVPEAGAAGSAFFFWGLDEGAEAFRPTNGLLEVPDVDGNAEEVGIGEGIILLKMPEIVEDELASLLEGAGWEVEVAVTALLAWVVAESLPSVAFGGVPTLEDSDEEPSVLAFFDSFNEPPVASVPSSFRFVPALLRSFRFKACPMRVRWAI